MTRAFYWFLSALLAAIVLVPSRPALAQATDEAAARALFHEGLKLHEARDFAGAIAKYRAAYARWKNPKILANIGTVCWELGRYAEAANAYDRFLTETPADSPERAEVQKALGDVVPKVGLLEISPDDPKLALTVDGRAVEFAAPGRLYVEPGAHQLQAQAEGGAAASQNVSVAAGAKARVVFLLTAATQAPAPAAQSDAHATPTRTKHSALPF